MAAAARPHRSLRVALVNMPFAVARRPSIACGLLKAGLVRAGHAVDVHYLNLELAAVLGHAAYQEIASVRTDLLLGEWLFTATAFGKGGDEERYRAACPGVDDACGALDLIFDDLCLLRNEAIAARTA